MKKLIFKQKQFSDNKRELPKEWQSLDDLKKISPDDVESEKDFYEDIAKSLGCKYEDVVQLNPHNEGSTEKKYERILKDFKENSGNTYKGAKVYFADGVLYVSKSDSLVLESTDPKSKIFGKYKPTKIEEKPKSKSSGSSNLITATIEKWKSYKVNGTPINPKLGFKTYDEAIAYHTKRLAELKEK